MAPNIEYNDTFIGIDDKARIFYNNFNNRLQCCLPMGKFYIFNEIDYVKVIQRTFLSPQSGDIILPLGNYNISMYTTESIIDNVLIISYFIKWLNVYQV